MDVSQLKVVFVEKEDGWMAGKRHRSREDVRSKLIESWYWEVSVYALMVRNDGI